ncbi:RDD family protein [Sinosporangium album]|uniref:RDD family protein n=2 Tax=Sinosporangium album TaxID=504805 RepID=A0A1G8J3D7_9ACTN|nr:RDD family protein [Sinosporangium album]
MMADALLALTAGVVAGLAAVTSLSMSGQTSTDRETGVLFLVTAAIAVFTVSFANHVVLTLWARASVGKRLAGLRLVRVADCAAPRFGQALGHWVRGLFTIVLIPLLALVEGGEPGRWNPKLRVVRRRDLACRSARPYGAGRPCL